jgi:hypothetical protein
MSTTERQGEDGMSHLKNAMDATATLPLKGTAFFFFLRRLELDFEEKFGPAWRGAARSTFRRLKILFPQVSDEELESALEAAAKFARDCELQIDWASGVDQATCVAEIVERARSDNPGFADATIEEARRYLYLLTR